VKWGETIKISKLLEQRSKLSAEEFREKITNVYIKEIILEQIAVKADDELVRECNVKFIEDGKEISIDDVVEYLYGEISQPIIDYVGSLMSFEEIEKKLDVELDYELDY